MGIEFRGKEYKRDVSLGKRTVKDGEAVAIWNRYGEHRQVIGPKLVRLFFSTIRFLDRKTAGPKEYLRVVLTNGTIEHLRGPVTLYENPVMHSSVEVLQAITLLAASDCIVIHRQMDTAFDQSSQSGLSSESIQRVVVRGPTTYFPGPRETLLKSPDSKASRGLENEAYIFNTASRSWCVETLFSFGGMRGTIRLLFRFTLSDVEVMLDNTSDLMGDLREGLTADLLAIAINTTDARSLEALHSFSQFPTLLTRSAAIGVTMEMVSFRGFEPSAENKKDEDALKQFNDKLARDAKLAQQEERRIAADIAARQARLAMEHDLEEAVLAGKQARLAAEQSFLQKQQECKEELEKRRIQTQLEYHQLVNDESLRVLQGLKDMGADITKLLCEGQKAAKPVTRSTAVIKDPETGREALIATSPALNDWFSVPNSAGAAEEEKSR